MLCRKCRVCDLVADPNKTTKELWEEGWEFDPVILCPDHAEYGMEEEEDCSYSQVRTKFKKRYDF